MDEELSVEADGIWERLRLGLWFVGAGVLPVWAMLTATLAQVHPDLGAVEVVAIEGDEVVAYLVDNRFEAAAWMAASWIAVLAVAVVPVVIVVGRIQARRAARAPQPPDWLDDSLVQGATWRVRVRGDGEAWAAEE